MNLLKYLSALPLALAISSSANAQITDRKVLTLDGARKVISAIKAEAMKTHAGGAIAVVDDGGNLIAVERIDNTFPAGANISIGKARTAAIFKKSTKFFEELIKSGRTPMIALHDFTPLMGGVPIVVDSQIVGAVGVSGASSAQQDEEFATIGANAISTSTTDAGPSVLFFDQAKVVESFNKGAVLFDGAGGRNYMIHTSRREKAGMAEVHMQDADLIYVQEGTCTFVTGGTVVDGKSTAPDEIRGSSIQGGESRKLSRGDVIIVPRGVPHWFQTVDAPFSYYVVKVR